MRVSIIVPTSGRASSLAVTVNSVLMTSAGFENSEILVIENGVAAGAEHVVKDVVAEHSTRNLRYIFDPIPGLLTGRHRGALEAKGDILVFVDDDIDADPGWLQAIVDTFADPSIQLVGGRNLPRYEVEPPAWIEGFRHRTPYGGWELGYLSLLDLGDTMLDIDANYIWGLNFAIRRQALFDLGGFHPDNIPDHLQHFQGDGESGLTMKANERGYRAVYQPKALVHHRIPASRLMPEYFERRAFYQGVCDSYTHIRRARGIGPLPWAPPPPEAWTGRVGGLAQKLSRYARHPLHHGRNFVRRVLASPAAVPATAEDEELQAVKGRVQTAYRAGYEFHRSAVQQEPLLLEWVLRQDYWDYRLPALSHPTLSSDIPPESNDAQTH